MLPDVRIFYQTPTSVAADWHNLSIVAWFAPAPLDAVRQLILQIAAASAACPSGFVHLVVLDHGGRPPSEEVREMIASCMREHSARLLGVAIVILNDGFVESTHRGVVTNILRSTGNPWLQQVFKTIDAAAQWTEELMRRSGVSRPAAQIAAVLNAIVALHTTGATVASGSLGKGPAKS